MERKDNISLGFPKMLYKSGQEPSPTRSINYRSKLELVRAVRPFIGEELWEIVKQSQLGVIAKFSELDFSWSCRVIHHVVTRQLAMKKKYELWFLMRNQPLRFSLKEYEDVTGLKCEGPTEEDEDVGNLWGFLGKLKMSGNRVNPTLEELAFAFTSSAINSRDDKLRVAFLVIVGSVILGFHRRSAFPSMLAKKVMDLEKFEAYPWGRMGFKMLASDVKKIDLSTPSYVMRGFVQVLQIWAYMVVPKLGEEVGLKFKNDGPPLLRYKGAKGKGDIGDEFEVEKADVGVDVPKWEDEADDEHVDNLVAYYKQNESFADVAWAPDGQLEPAVVTSVAKDKKRKGKEHVDKESSRVKRRTTEEDDQIGEKLKKIIDERIDRVTARIEGVFVTLLDKLNKVEADLQKLIVSGSGVANEAAPVTELPKSVTITRTPRKITPTKSPLRVTPTKKCKRIPPPKAAATKVPEKKLTKTVSQPDEKIVALGPRRFTRSQATGVNEGEKVEANDDESRVVGKPQVITGSTAVDSPPKPNNSIIPVVSDNMQPLQVVYPRDLSCQVVSGNTELRRKATDKKAAILYKSNRPQRERHQAAATRSPYVPLAKTKKHPFIDVCMEDMKEFQDWVDFGQENVFPAGSTQPVPEFFKVLREPTAWLFDYHMDAYLNVLRLRLKTNPQQFPCDRIAFLDTAFTLNWTAKYKDFLQNNEKFPGGSLEYYCGIYPKYASIQKRWGEDIDHLYGVLNVSNCHWVAIVISFTPRTIQVLDCSPSHNDDEAIATALKPFTHMLPHFMLHSASPYEQAGMSTKPYVIIDRERTVPCSRNTSGDCGVYALKFIECHARGISYPRCLCYKNMTEIRAKMALEMFHETFRHGTSTSALEKQVSVSDYGKSVEFLPHP